MKFYLNKLFYFYNTHANRQVNIGKHTTPMAVETVTGVAQTIAEDPETEIGENSPKEFRTVIHKNLKLTHNLKHSPTEV